MALGEMLSGGAEGRGGRGREGRGAPPCEGANTQRGQREPCEGADSQRGEQYCPPAVPSPSHLHVVILKQQMSISRYQEEMTKVEEDSRS